MLPEVERSTGDEQGICNRPELMRTHRTVSALTPQGCRIIYSREKGLLRHIVTVIVATDSETAARLGRLYANQPFGHCHRRDNYTTIG